jgi:hypothetical protein
MQTNEQLNRLHLNGVLSSRQTKWRKIPYLQQSAGSGRLYYWQFPTFVRNTFRKMCTKVERNIHSRIANSSTDSVLQTPVAERQRATATATVQYRVSVRPTSADRSLSFVRCRSVCVSSTVWGSRLQCCADCTLQVAVAQLSNVFS